VIIRLVVYIYFGPLVDIKYHYKFSINTVVNFFTCLIEYFYVREKRISYYYFKKLVSRNKWYNNIIENMNSGFFFVTNDKIKYMNKPLIKSISKSSQFAIIFKTEDIVAQIQNKGFSIEEYDAVLNLLFEDIKFQNDTIYEKSSYNNVKAYLIQKSLDNYCLIGYHSMIIENEHITYEIYERYCTGNSEKNFEFIFNDVSNVKMREECNAEYRYKSIFLSKIAHEFKNP
jgi:hypothetical protein